MPTTFRTTAISVALIAFGAGSVPTETAPKTTHPVVPLSVVVEPLGSDLTTDTRITGDGQPYVDGDADGTAAAIDKYGNLIVSFGRAVSFDYSAVLSGGGAPSGDHDASYISTVPREAGDGALQNLTTLSSQCVQLNWQFRDASGVLWRNGFHRDRDLPSQGGTSYAIVTRIDNDTWQVEPATFPCGTLTNPAGIARVFTQMSVRGKWVYTDYGTHSLSFRLTLTRAA